MCQTARGAPSSSVPLISSPFTTGSSGVGRQPWPAEGNAAAPGNVARREGAGGLDQPEAPRGHSQIIASQQKVGEDPGF